MDFDHYVAARYGRLIEHAVLLGCAEGEAGTYVDQVLLEQRKQIRRAEDPDPLVREALERAITGAPERRSRTGAFVALGLVAVAVAVVVALTYRATARADAVAVRTQRRPRPSSCSRTRATTSCSDPRAPASRRDWCSAPSPPWGTSSRNGATVTVRTAVPSGPSCDEPYAARSDAWRFVAFALGGPPPEFARTVTVVVNSQDPYPLDHVAAVDPDRWGGVFERVARTARAAGAHQQRHAAPHGAEQPPADRPVRRAEAGRDRRPHGAPARDRHPLRR